MLFACSLTPSVVIPKAPRAHRRNLGSNVLSTAVVVGMFSLSRILWSLWGPPELSGRCSGAPTPAHSGGRSGACAGAPGGDGGARHTPGAFVPVPKSRPLGEQKKGRGGGGRTGLGLAVQEQGDEPYVLGRLLGQGRWADPKLLTSYRWLRRDAGSSSGLASPTRSSKCVGSLCSPPERGGAAPGSPYL